MKSDSFYDSGLYFSLSKFQCPGVSRYDSVTSVVSAEDDLSVGRTSKRDFGPSRTRGQWVVGVVLTRGRSRRSWCVSRGSCASGNKIRNFLLRVLRRRNTSDSIRCLVSSGVFLPWFKEVLLQSDRTSTDDPTRKVSRCAVLLSGRPRLPPLPPRHSSESGSTDPGYTGNTSVFHVVYSVEVSTPGSHRRGTYQGNGGIRRFPRNPEEPFPVGGWSPCGW